MGNDTMEIPDHVYMLIPSKFAESVSLTQELSYGSRPIMLIKCLRQGNGILWILQKYDKSMLGVNIISR